MRIKRNLGARRIQTELIRLHQCKLSLSTIHKELKRQNYPCLVKLKRKKKYKRYARPVPGDKIQSKRQFKHVF